MTLAEIVSICLSATALVLSIFQIAKTAWEKREKYKLIVDNIQIIKLPSTPGIILNITIINNSTAPLNITRISYVSKNKDEFLCFLSKKWCGEHYYPPNLLKLIFQGQNESFLTISQFAYPLLELKVQSLNLRLILILSLRTVAVSD